MIYLLLSLSFCFCRSKVTDKTAISFLERQQEWRSVPLTHLLAMNIHMYSYVWCAWVCHRRRHMANCCLLCATICALLHTLRQAMSWFKYWNYALNNIFWQWWKFMPEYQFPSERFLFGSFIIILPLICLCCSFCFGNNSVWNYLLALLANCVIRWWCDDVAGQKILRRQILWNRNLLNKCFEILQDTIIHNSKLYGISVIFWKSALKGLMYIHFQVFVLCCANFWRLSISNNFENWKLLFALFIEELITVIAFCFLDHNMILQAEVRAIAVCLNWLNANTRPAS